MRRFALLFTIATLYVAPGFARAQAQQPPSSATTIQTSSNLVLVDVVATDKKGNYLNNLEKQDFHVFEDGKEQPIDTFSLQTGHRPHGTWSFSSTIQP